MTATDQRLILAESLLGTTPKQLYDRAIRAEQKVEQLETQLKVVNELLETVGLAVRIQQEMFGAYDELIEVGEMATRANVWLEKERKKYNDHTS